MLGSRCYSLRRFAGQVWFVRLVWFALLLCLLIRRAIATPHFFFQDRPTTSALDTNTLLIVFDEQCNPTHVKERTLRSTLIQGPATLAPYAVRVEEQQVASYEAYTRTRIALTFRGTRSSDVGRERPPVSCTVNDEVLHRVGVNILELLECPQLDGSRLKAAFELEPCVHSVEFSQQVRVGGRMRQPADRSQPTFSVPPVVDSSGPTASYGPQHTISPISPSTNYLPCAEGFSKAFDSFATSAYAKQYADCFPYLQHLSQSTDHPSLFTSLQPYDSTSIDLLPHHAEGASSSFNRLPHAYQNIAERLQHSHSSPGMFSPHVPVSCQPKESQYWRQIAGFTETEGFAIPRTLTVVALVDTGVAFGHPSLLSRAWTNTDEIPGNNVDDDGNGYIDDVHGFNFLQNSGIIEDDNGHGTHCAGIIAGERDDCAGTEGVCGCILIAALKFLGSDGTGEAAGAARALNYALQMKFSISNHSWGGFSYSPALRNAVYKAHMAGHLIIAAAGNSGTNIDAYPFYPAGYRLPNVVAVAASDDRDCIAGFSNTGVETVHVAAPGVGILSTFPPNTFRVFSGTSSAAPMVAGLAALLQGILGRESPDAIKEAIFSGVDELKCSKGRQITGGRINAAKSIGWLLGHEGVSDRQSRAIPLMFYSERPSAQFVGAAF